MKKIISIALISSVALMLSTGCSKSPSANDPAISQDALYINTQSNEKLSKAIHKAGEATGWKITEFKSNTVIAEKVDGDTTYSSTLKFLEDHIEFQNDEGTSDSDIGDLRDAIEEEANKTSTSH